MDNEVQGSPIAFSKDGEAKGSRVEGTHLKSDLELRGTPAVHHHFVGFTCRGVQEHGCCCTHACDPIHWHIHRGEDKEPSITRAGHVL